MAGSSRLDGKDGGIRIGRSERVRPRRVMGVASLSEVRAVSLASDTACVAEAFSLLRECIIFHFGYGGEWASTGQILKALGEWMMGEVLAVESTSERRTAHPAFS